MIIVKNPGEVMSIIRISPRSWMVRQGKALGIMSIRDMVLFCCKTQFYLV